MPLHDWADDRGWDGVHLLWNNALLCWVQDRLPADYRAYRGSIPGLHVGTGPAQPDAVVRTRHSRGEIAPAPGALVGTPQPDFKTVAHLHPEPRTAVHVFRQGQLVAAIELVSP